MLPGDLRDCLAFLVAMGLTIFLSRPPMDATTLHRVSPAKANFGRLNGTPRRPDRTTNPCQMTDAALTVLGAKPDQPFALFIEAGDVDFALHANNLDNAIGAIYSGEEAVRTVIRWVESHSNWDDSVLIVSSDHGHYLVVDDPQALAGTRQ